MEYSSLSKISNIKNIFDNQVDYFKVGHTLDIKFRISQLKKLKAIIKANESDIYEALNEDLGKSQFESYATEIGFVLDEINYHIKNLYKWSKPTSTVTPIINFAASSYITNEPLGCVLIIAPWNYPFHLLIAPLVGAISAGNTAILKPSEISSNTSKMIAELINSAFEETYIKVIEGDATITQELLTHKFDHIFFTGSPRVGKIIMQEAAKNLIPVTLELGGKSPCIIDENTNIKLAAKRIAWGKLINAGQTCIAPDYIYVHEDIKKRFLQSLKDAIIRFYGDDASLSPDYPRIINEQNVERLEALISSKNIYYGGNINKKKKYIEPTILVDVDWDMPVMQQEIFGPILPVLTYNSIDNVISTINSKPKPLALYYFSNCSTLQKKIVSKVSAGGVTINDTVMHIASNKLPFGGVGNSGIGSYHGKYSYETFSNRKPVVYKKTWIDVPIRYAPFKNKLKILKWIMG